MTSLSAKSFLLTKAKLPRWIVVVTSMANAVLTLLVFAVVTSLFIAASGRAPGPEAFAAFGVYLLALTLMVVGLSLASSVLFLRYRDLNQVWDMATQAGFFLAPIIEFSRAALVRHQVPRPTAHLYLALEVMAALTIGALVMRRHGPRAAEYV